MKIALKKKCSVCKNLFPEEEINAAGNCQKCGREKAYAWRAANPERYRQSMRDYSKRRPKESRRRAVLSVYGISVEQYDAMLVAQDHACKICRRSSGKKSLEVDHDHSTGAIRGLLCHKCNKVLGLMHDDPELLRKAAKYLEEAQ